MSRRRRSVGRGGRRVSQPTNERKEREGGAVHQRRETEGGAPPLLCPSPSGRHAPVVSLPHPVPSWRHQKSSPRGRKRNKTWRWTGERFQPIHRGLSRYWK